MNRRSLASSVILASIVGAPRRSSALQRATPEDEAHGPDGAQLRATWVDDRNEPSIQYSIRVTWYPPEFGAQQSMSYLKFWQKFPEDQFVDILGVEVHRSLSWAEFPLPPVGDPPRFDAAYWVSRNTTNVGQCVFSSFENIFIDQVGTVSQGARTNMEGLSGPIDSLIYNVLESMSSHPIDSSLEDLGSFLPSQADLDECGLTIKTKEEYEEL